jgi:hypothetical protein
MYLIRNIVQYLQHILKIFLQYIFIDYVCV